VEKFSDQRRARQADPLRRVRRWRAGGSAKSSARSASAVLRAGVRGVLGADDVELVERVYQRIQEARSHSTVQSDGEIGRLSGNSVLAVVLTSLGSGIGRPLLLTPPGRAQSALPDMLAINRWNNPFSTSQGGFCSPNHFSFWIVFG